MKSLEEFVGQRIAVYGPNFIWRGLLVKVDKRSITLDDVYQIFDTGKHGSSTCEDERMSDRQVFPIAAICNAGPTEWA